MEDDKARRILGWAAGVLAPLAEGWRPSGAAHNGLYDDQLLLTATSRLVLGHIRMVVRPGATPDRVFFVEKLPKTRSGKIICRVLLAAASESPIGNVATLEAACEELKRQI